MESRLLLDVVVGQSSAIFQLLTGKDQSLLVRWNTLLVLNFGFDVLDGVRCLDLQGDCLSCKGLDEDLHTTSKAEDQMESRLFLDVIVRKGSTVFKLFSSEDETLLVWRDTFILNFGLNIFVGVGCFNFEADRLSGESFFGF